MGSTEESDRKRRHPGNHSSLSPPLKKPQPMSPVVEDKKADPAMLQYQNHKLVQQLEVQKTEIHALEEKFILLKSKQESFDETLIAVNRCWSELVEDLELLILRAEPCVTGLKVLELDPQTSSDETSLTSVAVPPQEIFLQRLLESADSKCDSLNAALASRKSSTTKTMTLVVQSIDSLRAKNEHLCSLLKNQISPDDAGKLLQKVDDELRMELQSLRAAAEALHLKHKQLSAETRSLEDFRLKDEAEIRRLTGELEETISELESCRRKLAASKTQQSTPSVSFKEQGEKSSSKSSKEIKELEDALEISKDLAERRLAELQEAHQNNQNLSEQLQRLQDTQLEEQRVVASRPYIMVQEQVKFLRAEIERCQGNMDRLQAERDSAFRHEKEVALKAEAGEAARRAATIADSRISDLEAKLQQCIAERDELQIRLEELNQLSARKDTVSELKVMISTLHKEMGMMQAQLNKYKEAAHEVCLLRANVHSLSTMLDRKKLDFHNLSQKAADQASEVNSLKEEIKRLSESEQELKLILDMYERECTEARDVLEIQHSECRARAQVQRLKDALDEHSLELRVKAANEAEAACQQRLAAAEAEIVDLRQRLDATERKNLELEESNKAKNEEGDAFMSEIETIGQAYEDMQTQNQRLLQQISERDDYNTKLVAESLKAKQLQTSLLSEKQLISGRMQHVTSTADIQKQRCTRLEEQVKANLEQLAKATEESRQHQSALDVAKRKLAEAEQESHFLKSSLEAADREIQERGSKRTELQKELEKERYEKRRLEDELVSLKNKVARQSQEGGTLVDKLNEEVKKYRTILRCGVCHDRQKEVVITKCYHLFCNSCIQKTLVLRHRKCPGCGVAFGQGDVHNVYI